jgi:3'-5' exonuclease
MPMLFRVTDIETVPDLAVFTSGEPKWVQKVTLEKRPGPPGTTMGLQGIPLVDVPVAAWVKEDPFPPAQAHRVVAISWCDVDMTTPSGADSRTYKFSACNTGAGWQRDDDEPTLIAAFRAAQLEKPATLVTWNGRTFDLPVLAMRALHHGIPWGWYYDGRGLRYRYSDEGHCDLMDFLADYGATRQMKLGDACRLVGLPGKTDMDGSKVAELVAATGAKAVENACKIAKYCLQDSLQTALLFVRTRYHLGLLTEAGYRESIESFKTAEVTNVIDIDWRKLDLDRTVRREPGEGAKEK